jgi:hypothetical protein
MTSIINDRSKSSFIIRLSQGESPSGHRAKIFCAGLDKKQTQLVQSHVEQLVAARRSVTAIPPSTAAWVGDLKGPLRDRLEALQLIIPEKATSDITIVQYMERFIAALADKKPNTIRIYHRSLYFAKQFFGETRLTEVTTGQARGFKAFLLSPERTDGGRTLGENTARKMICKLKTVLTAAVEEELITKNPFKVKGLSSSVSASSKERERFIEQADVDSVIGSAPDDEFALIIALARYGGLRTPSEFPLLTHGSFKLSGDAPHFEVFAPKTGHCKPDKRIVPVFPELLPYVEKVVSISRAKQGGFVFSDRYRTCTEANITNTMRRTIKKAGLQIWPKLWQNLRASRETELLRRFDIKDVCNWLGNTPAVALKHYLRADNDALRKATQAVSPPVTGDLSGELNTPEPTELAGTERKSTRRKDQQKTPILRKASHKRAIARGRSVLPVGAELSGVEPIKDGESETVSVNGDPFGDLGAQLMTLLAKWSELSPELKDRFRTILNASDDRQIT